jgi:DNA-directed RNA polymerase subunit beta
VVVRKGDIIADGPSTDLGELALGRNVLVAFMPWNGYNFEDSILLSERIVKDDVFTSIHIEEFEVMARDTKLGPEEITRDIPNVGRSAEEPRRSRHRLYRRRSAAGRHSGRQDHAEGRKPDDAGRKAAARHLRRKGLRRARHLAARAAGRAGTIVEVRVFNRHGVDKDERALAIEREEIERLAKDRDDEQAILDRNVYARLPDMLLMARTRSPGRRASRRARKITERAADESIRGRSGGSSPSPTTRLHGRDRSHAQAVRRAKKALEQRFDDKVEKLQRGDELPPGVMKMVKVFVAVKRKIQPGDKMAGRHGNKGVVSRIVPQEDMPFLEDGTPVDIVLNPLGVPSRMNVGQILETHLGWACARPGPQIGEALDSLRQRSRRHAPLREAEGNLRPANYDRTSRRDLTDEPICRGGENLRAACRSPRRCSTARKRSRHRRDAEAAGSRHLGSGRRSMTAAPASRSIAR